MKTPRTYYGLAVAVAVATVLFLILAIGALGILGEGGRPDRVYAAVLAVLVVGTVVARLRAPGMALVLMATAGAQALVTVVALVVGLPPEGASVADILVVNAMYAGLFTLSAWLFRQASEARAIVEA
ncbi:hypothetical protein [Nocardioides sp. LHG3406-4]|uniref:hypothetical protein n=1 Tax=Nocardioides sp. LHG3406-4 TaxID=2804575 RepID=UPI003CF6587F